MNDPAMSHRSEPARDALSRPLHDLRISVIDRCNFRCTYCMPEDQYAHDHAFLPKDERLRFEEIERIARAFAALGVRKLRLTGGEPLLRRDLSELVRQLARIPGVDDIALTTNGVLLPKLVQKLRDAGLQRLTVSLDSLDAATFRDLSGGRGEVAEVLAGIDAAERAGFASIKINCVVLRGVNDHQVTDLAEHFRGTPHVVRFIEYMDVGTLNRWSAQNVVPSAELLARLHARWPLRPLDPNYRGEVAQRYAYADGAGEIGFISSVSQPFCGDCSRARLSADGRLYTCLFARAGFDLRGPLRDGAGDEELMRLIGGRWAQRSDRYSEQRAQLRAAGNSEKVEMFSIGG
ncbi:MAG: GTP 3',8-cyclase MoaA [Xanthomonadales bacterium PRO7]|jgi:cyclic pyranopterin phosphate synthase|nr:GTP 3',8-cyclase MoaA [Xanthomonadales bacterium PRO7]HMM57305.1 GTP 3',8-cyclase MoaA [Rudaea sp.]